MPYTYATDDDPPDYAEEQTRIAVLNRLDQWHPCDFIVSASKDGPEYCELPEHDPYSRRCYAHSYDLPGWKF